MLTWCTQHYIIICKKKQKNNKPVYILGSISFRSFTKKNTKKTRTFLHRDKKCFMPEAFLICNWVTKIIYFSKVTWLQRFQTMFYNINSSLVLFVYWRKLFCILLYKMKSDRERNGGKMWRNLLPKAVLTVCDPSILRIYRLGTQAI